jgi:hypothetical protein
LCKRGSSTTLQGQQTLCLRRCSLDCDSCLAWLKHEQESLRSYFGSFLTCCTQHDNRKHQPTYVYTYTKYQSSFYNHSICI